VGEASGWSVDIYEDSVLSTLEQAADEIAEAIGFDKADVVAWILAGEAPTIIPFSMRREDREITLPDGRRLSQDWELIEIAEPEQLTYDHFLLMYHSMRQAHHVSRTKALNTNHERRLRIIERYGGEPTTHGAKKAFWEQVRLEWNREVGQDEYSHWRPLEKQYRRIIRKMPIAVSATRNGKKSG
jgi:hypothetical protein